VSVNKKDRIRAKRRALRVRHGLKKYGAPRVSVFRSLKYIYAQIIDDVTGHTLASCSSLELKDVNGDKKTIAHTIGAELAKRAKEKNIEAVIFDRGRFHYHGRVKSLADGLREGGIKF
jgi:large subunit ribosomal protein L18